MILESRIHLVSIYSPLNLVSNVLLSDSTLVSGQKKPRVKNFNLMVYLS